MRVRSLAACFAAAAAASSAEPFAHGMPARAWCDPPPLIMTTALRADSRHSRQHNGTQRSGWARAILRRYMRETSLRVVVADATATEADLRFLRRLGPPSRLELLPLRGAFGAQPSRRSKGYLEYRSIRHASEHALSVRNCSHFAHATGNRFVQSAEAMLRQPAAHTSLVGLRPPRTPIGLWATSLLGMHAPDARLARVDPSAWYGAGGPPSLKSDLVLWTREFLTTYFHGEAVSEECDGGAMRTGAGGCGYFENVLARGALKAMAEGRAVLWFACVHVHGWSGTFGAPQNDVCR